MILIEYIFLVFIIILITRGWMFFCYKYSKTTILNYISNIVRLNTFATLFDLRIINDGNRKVHHINLLTIALCLFILLFIIYPFI